MKTIKADNWNQFRTWFPEIGDKLIKNVDFTSIEIKCEGQDPTTFIFTRPLKGLEAKILDKVMDELNLNPYVTENPLKDAPVITGNIVKLWGLEPSMSTIQEEIRMFYEA